MTTTPAPSPFNEREFWHLIRQALLMMVDTIERRLGISPRTSELRKRWKNDH